MTALRQPPGDRADPQTEIDGDCDSPPPEGFFRIDGIAFRCVCVDGIVPRHQSQREQSRTRLTYLDGEVVHFEMAGHRYALIPARDAPAGASARTETDTRTDAANVHALLTNRELQIVQLICVGLLTKQVADRLRISEFTVRSYLKTIYCKLGVRSRGAMVYRYAQAFRAPPSEN